LEGKKQFFPEGSAELFCDNFIVRCKVIDQDIVYSEIEGAIPENDVEEALTHLEHVLEKNDFSKDRRYYQILN
jgi:hypothetical protein